MHQTHRHLLAGLLSVLLAVACDSSNGSGDSETNWIKCTTDLECPSDQACVAERCAPRTDAGAAAAGGAGSGGRTASGGAGGATSAGGKGGATTGGRAPFSTGGASGPSAGGAPDASAGGSIGAPDASTGGTAVASTGGATGASDGGSPDASVDGAADASADGTSDASADGSLGRDGHDVPVTIACGAPGSDYFVDPVNGNDGGNGSGKSPSDAPAPDCAFKTITRAVAALPTVPPAGTRIIVIGPARVDAGETFPIELPANVVLTTQGGDVDLRPSSGVDSVVRLSHPSSGIRGGAGAVLTLWPFYTPGVEVAGGSDDTTFIEDVVIQGYQSPGIQVNADARLTIGEGVTARGNMYGMVVDGHATISVQSGHRTTSFIASQHLNEPPPPLAGNGLLVTGSVTIHGVPGESPDTGTIVVSRNCGDGVSIVPNYLGTTSPESVIDGLVVYGNGVSGFPCGGYTYSGIFIAGGSNVKIRNSVVLGNGISGVVVRTMTANDGRRLNDLSKIDLGTAAQGDAANDYGHNVFQALPGQNPNGGAGVCLFVDHGSGTLNAAGNIFAGPRDCAGSSPGALTMANSCGTRADLGIVTTTDGGLFMDGGDTRGNSINPANCTH